ncbi:Uncharacterised protein [uncultured Clostridium sp.]|nr:hypothetical protein [uncultured Clostridium sp.]SCJ99064.1 Uncharacterised protein [uncultured Clostridium sp.]
MKKYKVKVEQIKEYEIEIDDSKISIEDLEAKIGGIDNERVCEPNR